MPLWDKTLTNRQYGLCAGMRWMTFYSSEPWFRVRHQLNSYQQAWKCTELLRELACSEDRIKSQIPSVMAKNSIRLAYTVCPQILRPMKFAESHHVLMIQLLTTVFRTVYYKAECRIEDFVGEVRATLSARISAKMKNSLSSTGRTIFEGDMNITAYRSNITSI